MAAVRVSVTRARVCIGRMCFDDSSTRSVFDVDMGRVTCDVCRVVVVFLRAACSRGTAGQDCHG